MGFIDGDETDLHMAQLRLEEFGGKALGRDIEQFHIAENAVFEGDDDFLVRQTGIDGCSLDASAEEVVHLVFHQGDKGRDDDADAFLRQGRHLEGDALATTRGHQTQCVVA